MSIELSKKDKKLARELIEQGLQAEFRQFMEGVYVIMQKWKSGKENDESAYRIFYKSIKDFDKHIAHRYDHLSGSTYLFVLAALVKEKLISQESVKTMDQSAQQAILFLTQENDQ